jgi:hypothetical protein
MDSIANPHLNNDPGAIIAFPDETFGLIVTGNILEYRLGYAVLRYHNGTLPLTNPP